MTLYFVNLGDRPVWDFAVDDRLCRVQCGAALRVVYELWARGRYVGTGRRPRRLIRVEGVEGVVMWPAMIPGAANRLIPRRPPP
jgi:hypothetical protein